MTSHDLDAYSGYRMIDEPQIEKASIGRRMLGLAIAPEYTFKYLFKYPDWLTPLLSVAISALISTLIILPRAMDKIPLASNTQVSSQIVRISVNLGIALAPFMGIASFLVTIWIIYTVGRMLLGHSTFKIAIATLGYANLPNVFKTFLLSGTTLITGRIDFSPGLSGLLSKEANPYLLSILSGVDVFSIWGLYLTIIAFAVTFGFSKKKSASIILALWLAGIILQGTTGSILPNR